MNNIKCHKCKKNIEKYTNLRTVVEWGALVRPYHSKCLDNKLTTRFFFSLSYGLTGFIQTILIILTSAAILYIAILSFKSMCNTGCPVYEAGFWVVAIPLTILFLYCLLPLFLRMYSYYKYEKPMKSKIIKKA